MQRIILICSAIFFLGAVMYAWWGNSSNREIPLRANDMEVPVSALATLTDEEKHLMQLISASEHGIDQNVPKDFYEKNYQTYGPEKIKTALDAMPFCHTQAHNFGRVIYDHTKNLTNAVTMCGNTCTGGCIHGVLMEMYETNDDGISKKSSDEHITVADLSPSFRQKVHDSCSTGSPVVPFTGEGNCYHAVGHALAALTDLDIGAALNLCLIFKDAGPGAVYYCATGVYMERDVETGSYDAQISKSYPCDDSPFPAACYRYKLVRSFNLPYGLKDAQAFCDSLSNEAREGCFHAVGFGAFYDIYNKPASINDVCGVGTPEDQRMCLEGALPYLNMFHHEKSVEACKYYWHGDRNACKTAAKLSNFDMTRDFGPYTKKAEIEGFLSK